MNSIMRVSFYQHKGLPGLEKITDRQKFGNHTLVTAEFKVSSSREFLLPPENTPVLIEYGVSPLGVRSFYGYVNHYEAVGSESGSVRTRMVVLGASKVMNTANPRVWAGQSHPGIVREIATRHRMRSVTHSHSMIMPTWATGGRTDFQCLQDLADEIGYRVWVDGATVWFLDPARMLRSASTMSTPAVRSTSVRRAQVLGGTNIPGEVLPSKRRVQFGVDDRTNKMFEATSGSRDLPVDVLVGSSSRTFGEAVLDTFTLEKRQQDQEVLKMTIDGAANLSPGSLVNVEPGKVNKEQGGLWVVNEASHEISLDDFTTSLVCTRGAGPESMTRLPVSVQPVGNPPRAVLRNGITWEAEFQERIRV